MNDTNTKDYMIDVAQDTTYQNQSDDYKKSFAKWRSNPQNSFGFQFTHDTREHSYIDAAKSGALCIEKLEAMTAVCSVGLDMICIPGDTPADTISAIIADEAAIGMVNNKTTAVRVIPAIGKGVGEELDWGGLFGCGPVMPLKKESPSKFINRGGQIPAPLHSLKN